MRMFLVGAAALAACGPSGAKPKDPDEPVPTQPTGLLLYQDDDALRWYDVETQQGGDVSPPLGYPDWSRNTDGDRAAWVHGYDAADQAMVAVVHRDGELVAARSLGQDVLGVSPDGSQAIVPCPDEFHWCLAPVDDDGLGAGAPLVTGSDYPELAGWLDDGRVVIVDLDSEAPIHVLDPATGVSVDGGQVDATETPIVSQDGQTLAWLTSDDEDFATAATRLSWRRLDDLAGDPRVVDVGAGYTGECTFASGGRTIVCLLMVYDEDRSRVVSVDLATEAVTLISEHAVSVWPAVSPDGAFLAFAEDLDGSARLVIAPVAGGKPDRVFGDGTERQFAVSWLR